MSEPRPIGRRIAIKPQRSRPAVPRVPLVLLLLLAAVVLVLVTPESPGPVSREQASQEQASRGEPVTQTAIACPRRLVVPAGVETSYGVALAAMEDAGESGSLEPSLDLRRGGSTAVPDQTAFQVTGSGGFAQGLFGWRADTGASTAVLECASPRASWWFTGVGTALDHESILIITNLDSGPAVVDIRALSPDGEVDLSATGGTGITVPFGAHLSIPLVELAPQNEELSLWVHATRGRVVAAVSDRFAQAPTADPGYEWLPSQDAPSRLVRLSGMPPRAKERTLLVANPSDSESVLTVEVAGPSGRIIPTDLGDLAVEPGDLLSVDVSDVLPGEAYSLRVVGTAPVVATARSVGRTGDIAYAGAAQPLSAPAALPVVGDSTVQLTAGGQTARAVVTAYDQDGESVDTSRLSLAPFATSTWPVPEGASYVVLEPVQGAPYGSVVYDGVSAVPLRELPLDVRVPVVRPAN